MQEELPAGFCALFSTLVAQLGLQSCMKIAGKVGASLVQKSGIVEQFNPTIALEQPWTATGAPKPLPATVPQCSYPGAVPPCKYLGASVRAIRSYDMIRAMKPSYTDPYLQWQTLPPLGWSGSR